MILRRAPHRSIVRRSSPSRVRIDPVALPIRSSGLYQRRVARRTRSCGCICSFTCHCLVRVIYLSFLRYIASSFFPYTIHFPSIFRQARSTAGLFLVHSWTMTLSGAKESRFVKSQGREERAGSRHDSTAGSPPALPRLSRRAVLNRDRGSRMLQKRAVARAVDSARIE